MSAEAAYRFIDVEAEVVFIDADHGGDIEMAAYATALKGTAAAQALYLKFHPPPRSENVLGGDDCEEYTDAQLIELSKQAGLSIPPELLNDEL